MIRKALTLIAAAALLAVSGFADEPTLEDVLNGYYEAIGGRDAWSAVESFKMIGNMNSPDGMQAPFVMLFKRPMRFRFELTDQEGMTVIQAYDGEAAWFVMPFVGKSEPEPMTEEQTDKMKEQSDIDGPLVDWEAKGHQVELVGMEEVEGIEAFHVRVILDSGDQRDYYLDSEYYLPFKMEGTTTMRGEEVEIETALGDYKVVDGLIMAHSVESKPKGAPAGQVITIETVELNAELADDLFVMPADESEDEGPAD